MEATPQLRRPWGHRIQRSQWRDLPSPQLVIWGALPENTRIVPVRDVDSGNEVCTVEIEVSASPLDVLIAAERKCPWMQNLRQDVARQARLFLVDRVRKDPFSTHELATAHMAEVSSTLLHVGPTLNPGRRWGGAVPSILPTLQVDELPHAILRRRIVVHTAEHAPRELDGTGLAAAQMAAHISDRCHLRPGSLLRLPTFCPFGQGHPLHVFMATSYDERLSRLDYWGLFDLRSVVAPPRVPFCMLPLPTIFDGLWLQERLCICFPELDGHLVLFMNEQLVQTHCSPQGSVPLFTVFDRRHVGARRPHTPQVLVETTDLLHRCFGRASQNAAADVSGAATSGTANATAASTTCRSRAPAYPWQVPTHLESHAMTSGPATGLGCTFVLIAPLRVPVEHRPRGPLQPPVLCQQAITALGLDMPCTMHIPTLCPSTSGESPFAVLLPADRRQDMRYVLVDASRVVHPPCCRFWVQLVPNTLSPVSAVATLRRAQPALQVMGLLFLDCRPIRSLIEVGPHVPLLTILPESFAWDSLPSPLLGRLLASRRIGLSAASVRHDSIGQLDPGPPSCGHVRPHTATSTTTTLAHLATSTTTTAPPAGCRSGAQHVDHKPMRFFIASVSGHVEALTLTGNLPLAEILAQLCWQLKLANAFARGVSYKACDRVLSDLDLGFSVFIATYNPAVGEQAWLDFDPAYRYPSAIRLPFLLTTDSLFDLCDRSLPTETCVAISGTPWDGQPVQLLHSDVVTVRRHNWQLFSLPLFAFEGRVDGIYCPADPSGRSKKEDAHPHLDSGGTGRLTSISTAFIITGNSFD